MLGVQFGTGVVHEKVAPEGVDVSVVFTDVPEQILLENGALTSGIGLIVTGSDVVGPAMATQLVLVPKTSMLPEVAPAAKSTNMKASVGFVWVIVAPVPV
jgi:hypothetical protein